MWRHLNRIPDCTDPRRWLDICRCMFWTGIVWRCNSYRRPHRPISPIECARNRSFLYRRPCYSHSLWRLPFSLSSWRVPLPLVAAPRRRLQSLLRLYSNKGFCVRTLVLLCVRFSKSQFRFVWRCLVRSMPSTFQSSQRNVFTSFARVKTTQMIDRSICKCTLPPDHKMQWNEIRRKNWTRHKSVRLSQMRSLLIHETFADVYLTNKFRIDVVDVACLIKWTTKPATWFRLICYYDDSIASRDSLHLLRLKTIQQPMITDSFRFDPISGDGQWPQLSATGKERTKKRKGISDIRVVCPLPLTENGGPRSLSPVVCVMPTENDYSYYYLRLFMWEWTEWKWIASRPTDDFWRTKWNT